MVLLSLLAATFVSHLLITFANRLDLEQAQENVGPDLGPTDSVPERIFRKS